MRFCSATIFKLQHHLLLSRNGKYQIVFRQNNTRPTISISHFQPLHNLYQKIVTTMATSIDLSEPEPISPFLRNIPSEIRNTIYSLIFQADSKDAVTPISVTDLELETGRPLRRLNIEHPLLRTCKQIRHEAAGIYYTETTFELTADSIERSAAEKVCHKLSPCRQDRASQHRARNQAYDH